MGNARIVGVGAALVLAALAAACSSSGSKSSSTAASAATVADGDKAAFCGANSALDKALLSPASEAAFLTALKGEQANVDVFASSAPNAIKADATVMVTAARAAIAQNSATPLNAADVQAAGGRVNAFCGVQSDGTPVPANAGTGKGSPFCDDQLQLDTAVQAAADANALVTALKANTARIDDFEKNAPPGLQADVQVLVSAARAAVAANDATKLGTTDVAAAVAHVNTYCGIGNPSTPTTGAPTTTSGY